MHVFLHYILSDFVKIVIVLSNKDNIEKGGQKYANAELLNIKTSVKKGFQTTYRGTI